MKKTVFFILLTTLAVSVFAVQLPTGQAAAVRNVEKSNGAIVSAEVLNPVSFDTVLGAVSSKEGRTVEFYESGSLKKVYSNDTFVFKSPAGSLNLKSPFEFYETGELKSAVLLYSSTPIMLDTPIGTLEAIKETPISFFKDGSVEEFSVSQHNKQLPCNLKGGFSDITPLIFYENGNVKELTPAASNLYKPLGISLKSRAPITFYDSQKVQSFTAVENSFVKIADGMFPLKRNSLLELYEDGSIQRCIIECTSTDFAVGDTVFSYGAIPEKLEIQTDAAFLSLELTEDGKVKRAEAAPSGGARSASFPVILLTLGKAVAVKSIDFDAAGKPSRIDFFTPILVGAVSDDPYAARNPLVKLHDLDAAYLSDIKPRNDSMYYYIWRCYYSDGNETYFTGREIDADKTDYFYTKQTTGIFRIQNKKVTEVIPAEKLNADSDIQFDDTGRPSSYTFEESDDKITVIKL